MNRFKMLPLGRASVPTVLVASLITITVSMLGPIAIGERAYAMDEQSKSSNPLSRDEAAIAEGKALYRARCGLCHGLRANGRGRGLPNSADLRKFKRGYAKFVEAVRNGWRTMPAWGGMGVLDDMQIQQIGAYLETLAIAGANWRDKTSSLPAIKSTAQASAPASPGASVFAVIAHRFLSLVVSEAQAADEDYRAQLDHLSVASPATPGQVSLLAVLEKDARIAQEHAKHAVSDLKNLDNVQAGTRKVRHAVDPSKAKSAGPGSGYGVCAAAKDVVTHAQLAHDAKNASESARMHATHILASASNIVFWCGKILDKAGQILGGASPVASAFYAEETMEHLTWILEGRDADKDGTISWREGEGGLAQIKAHLALID